MYVGTIDRFLGRIKWVISAYSYCRNLCREVRSKYLHVDTLVLSYVLEVGIEMVSASPSANCEESFSLTESAMDDSSARMKEGGRGETVY